jgi:hypothetical protein
MAPLLGLGRVFSRHRNHLNYKLNAEIARTIGTTLWLSKDDIKDEKLKKIIVAGQFSICSNLLEYLINHPKDDRLSDEQLTEVDNIKGKLLNDWKQFLAHP